MAQTLPSERMLALGSSMFPCVLSGSVLTLQRAAAERLRVGDIVVYVSSAGLCAHRLLRIEQGPAGRCFVMRGDAQGEHERVEEAALVYVVRHVAHRFLRYRTDSGFGQLLARLALARGPLFRLGAAGLGRLARFAPARRYAPGAAVVHLSSLRPTLFPEGRAEDDSRDSLLRGLKHELRTPLNAILGFAELLLGELDGPLLADERENVSVVRDAGNQLLALINEVLDLATALMAPAEPVHEEHDVIALLEDVRAEIEQRRGVRPVHVGVESALGHLPARVDARLLSRVLRVLGDSALLATSAGGITLGAERGSAEELGLWVAADGFELQADADPVQVALGAHRPQDRAHRISGMRVAIALRLLANQGAELEARRVGAAVALYVRLPLTAAGPPADAADAEPVQSADVSLALSYIAAMSHDLRTPLNAILGFADLLSMQRRDAWAPAQRRSLEIVRERAVDLAAMIDDMIDWAKLEAGELVLRREPCEVRPLLERALAAAGARSGARGLSLRLSVEAQDAGVVRADPERCVQAFLGLLDQAIRATPGREVQVRLQRTAAKVRIEIEDPGLVIRAEDHTGVFDAFRPSYAPTGQRIAGLQLGPAVARSLFRAHGGDVWFESRPGRGTTFTVILPLASAPDAR